MGFPIYRTKRLATPKIIIRRLSIPGVGKIKNIGLILDRQRAFAGRRMNINGTVKVGEISWLSFTADPTFFDVFFEQNTYYPLMPYLQYSDHGGQAEGDWLNMTTPAYRFKGRCFFGAYGRALLPFLVQYF
jgi:hypothetical protein